MTPPRPQARPPLPPSAREMSRPKAVTEGEICRGSAVAYGAMHPKGTCSASLHCVGIAPYGMTTESRA